MRSFSLRKTGILSAALAFILALLGQVFSMAFDKTFDVEFKIDASSPGGIIGNKVSNANLWDYNHLFGDVFIDELADSTVFTEYIQLMTATGGNAQRDLFSDPLDRSVLDDYNFTPLLTACRKILDLGAKPHIKTGAVPLKLTTDPHIGFFGVNVYPPDDFDEYYTYMAAIAGALVDTFGKDEVLTWRFGVLTEYENKDWFMAKSGTPEDSAVAYCKLYDYTVAALQDVIGEDVFVGAHSMSVSEGLWDERIFIEHCAKGINYKTGETGSRLCFLNASFYDMRPGVFADINLPETIEILREKALSLGLTDLIYGVDEGRILSGTKGAVAADLNLRICGYTYQAAYDARLIKQMADNDIDYFSSWGYTSAGQWGGIPTVSYHVARRFYDMADTNRVPATTCRLNMAGAEVQALAGFDSQNQKLHIMAYNFKNKLDYSLSAKMALKINIPQFEGKSVKVTRYIVDDNANFFDEWQRDRATHNITDDCFTWSPDDPAVDSAGTLSAPWAREIYFNELKPVYRERCLLHPSRENLRVIGSSLTLYVKAPPNAVVFYTVEPV